MHLQEFLLKHKTEALLLVCLSFIAFGILSIPSQTYPNINEFDPFYHARVIETFVKTGTIPAWETMSYWPEGMPMWSLYPHLFHWMVGIAYWIVALLLTGSTAYNAGLFVKVLSWSMPFVGVFATASMFLLGNELRNKKAGFFAAIAFLFSSNLLYRDMYSEIELAGVGIAWALFAVFAWVYAARKPSWKTGLFAGLALTGLLLSWTGVIYVAALIAFFLFYKLVTLALQKERKRIEEMTVMIGAGIAPVILLGAPLITVPFNFVFTAAMIGINLLLFTAATYWLNYRAHAGEKVLNTNYTAKQAYTALLAVLLLATLGMGAWKGPEIVNSVLAVTHLGEYNIAEQRIPYTVAEQHTTDFSGVVSSMGWLALFGLVAMPYFLVRTLLKWKDTKVNDVLVLVFMLTAMFLMMKQGKYAYFFAPASFLAIGMVMSDMISLGKRLGKWGKRLAVVIVGIMLFVQIGVGVATMESLKTQYPVQDGWFKTMDWLKTTPQDTALLTWWDYGHWIAFLGERHAIVDNTNINATKVENIARMFTEYRGNSTQIESEVLDQLRDYNVTHVGVDRILLWQKFGALTFIAQNQCVEDAALKAQGLSFPWLADVSAQACPQGYTYSGDMGIARCSKKTVTSALANETTYECPVFQGAPIKFTEAQWSEVKASVWPGYDLMLTSSQGQQIALRVYGQPDDAIMFFKAGDRLVPDAPVNYMYAFRLFFKDPGLKHHELVQNQWLPNEEVVVYKVNY
jgi:asparagine N-glycosylation enzyme membrane subunit Stt3